MLYVGAVASGEGVDKGGLLEVKVCLAAVMFKFHLRLVQSRERMTKTLSRASASIVSYTIITLEPASCNLPIAELGWVTAQ